MFMKRRLPDQLWSLRWFGVPLLLVMVSVAVAGAASVTSVCHFPPDNPMNYRTVTMSPSALPAHLAHGDFSGACVEHCAEICDDHDLCTVDTAQPNYATGRCDCARAPVDCSDGNACTLDICIVTTGCVHSPLIGNACDDGNVCTGYDTCSSSGQCVGDTIADCCMSDADCNPPATCGGGADPNLCGLTIGWANLQWPPLILHTISAVNRTPSIFGQVWISGVTNKPGQTPGLWAQTGYGPAGTDPAGNPAWIWVDAIFNGDAGNNDEFRASFLPDAVGTYDYVYRYSTTNGQQWLYADLNGPVPDLQAPPNPGYLAVSPSSDATSPDTPTGLIVTSATASTVALAWDAVLGDPSFYGYEVMRGDVAGGPYVVLAFVSGIQHYTDGTVTAGSTCYYVVRAVDLSFNRSGLSNEVQALAVARTVTLVFNVTVPATTDATGRSVYIAGFLDRLDGNLPQWNPGGVVLTRVDATHWTITLTGDESTQIEYRYTLGDWDHVEKDAACGEIANRQITLTYGGTGTQTVDDTVLNWRNVSPCGN
jgi:hypothetical protein